MNGNRAFRQLDIKDLEDLYGEQLDIKSMSKIRGSPRARDIAKRFALDENDGRNIDEHDQFYRDHKLLLILFKWMGVMPVERGEIGKITFSWTSKPMLYAYGFYVITTIIVLLVGYERVDILLNKSRKFDEYIYAIIFIVFLVPHFFVPFVGWSVAYEVCDYKNSWGRFQLNYYKITGRDLEFPYLSTLIGTISLGCLFLAVSFLLSLSTLLEGFALYHTIGYLHIVTMINMNCALWYINCRAIGNASTGVAESFKKDIQSYCVAYIIRHYRVLWLELSEILQKLGNAYARTYSSYCLLMMTNIIISVYGFTSEVVDHGVKFTFKEMGLLVDAIYCFTLLFIFCDCSHKASANIAERVQWALMEIDLNQVDHATIKEDTRIITTFLDPNVFESHSSKPTQSEFTRIYCCKQRIGDVYDKYDCNLPDSTSTIQDQSSQYERIRKLQVVIVYSTQDYLQKSLFHLESTNSQALNV